MPTALSWNATIITTCLLGVLAHPTVAAIMYRWSDINGRPVISDRPPPPGTAYTTLDSAQYRKSAIRRDKKASDTVERGATNPSRQAPSESPAASVHIQKNADLCKHAQDNIYTHENFSRIRTVDPDGTVRFISSAEIEVELSDARQVEKSHC
ncbi:MAG: DUF4124 domain-containing protein [Luminiphilus sp.]|nr:DUF4124 domain-containing protein [Luminiphilus sp.]